ncbi:MAG: hypothetical protein QM496_00510 [Verrucomicrobiota bacterium]
MFSFKTSTKLTAIFSFFLLGTVQAEGLKLAKLDRKSEVNFNKEIYPFFKRNCLACHNHSKAKAKLILETPDDIRKGSSDGPVVVAGKAEESLLFTTSAHIEEDVMPPKNNKSKAKNLTPHELALLKLWIDQGVKGSGTVIAEAPEKWLKFKSKQPVYALTVSPDGRYAAAGHGQNIDIYDIKLKTFLTRLIDPALKSAAHLDLVRSLAFDQDGTLASGGYRVIKLWQPSSMAGEKVTTTPSKAYLLTSKDQSWSISLNKTRDQVSRLMQKGEVTQPLKFADKISSIAILDDQKQITLAFDNGTLRILKIEAFAQATAAKPTPVKKDAKPVKTVAAATPPALDKKLYFDLKAHAKPVQHFFSDTLYPLVSADSSGKVIIWDLKQKKAKATFNHGGALKHIALHSKANRLITTNDKGRVLLWDLKNPAKYLISLARDPNIDFEIQQLTSDKNVAKRNITRHDARIKILQETAKKELESANSVPKQLETLNAELKTQEKKLSDLSAKKIVKAKSKDAKEIKKVADETQKHQEAIKLASEEIQKSKTRLVSIKNGKDRALQMQKKANQDLATTQNDKKATEALVKSLEEKLKKLNDLQSKTVPQYLIAGSGFSADGLYLAVAYQNGNVHLYDSETGHFIESINTKKPLKSFAFKKGARLVTTGEDGQSWSWPTQRSWKYSQGIGNGKDGAILIDRVTALGFGADASLVSASGIPSRKGQLKLWDKKTLKLKAKDLLAHTDLISSLNFSPDKKRFVTGSSDGTAKIYQLPALKKIRSLEGHALAVLDASWSGDGHLIATSGADKNIILWNTETGEKFKTILGKGEEVTVVQFLSKTNDSLLTAEGSGMLKANNKNLPGEFEYAYSASLSPDGKLILAGGLSGTLRLWDASKYSLLKSFEPAP